MNRRTPHWIAACGFVVLLLLHLDFWRPQRGVLLLGWLPEELGYRLAYCVLAWFYILYICAWVWREESDP